MLSQLDTAKTWFLKELIYAESLSVVVIEGVVGEERERVPGIHLEAFPLTTSGKSREFQITFPQFITWQVVDESFSDFDKSEVKEDAGRFIQTITSARYFDYVRSTHGRYETMIGKAKMYRVWTENEVLEIIACEPPEIVEITPAMANANTPKIH